MRYLLTSFLCVFTLSLTAQMTGISIEADTVFYGVDTPTQDDTFDVFGELDGYVTYKIYADFTNPTDVLSALYSDVSALGTIPMQIDAQCGCFNPLISSVVMDQSNPSEFWEDTPMLQYDSYWTIGMESSDDPGELPSHIGLPPGSDICSSYITNGSMYNSYSPINSIAGDDLRILVAQVTTCGDWIFGANFQVFIMGDQTNIQMFEMTEPILVTEYAGCWDLSACNYNPDPDFEDGSCEYAETYYNCDGSCVTDTDGDGVCDIYEIEGCATPFACNYDPEATDDDGSCIFICDGCVDPLACNYEVWANVDIGSCEYLSCAGCTDPIACNYNSESTIDDNSCYTEVAPFLNCFGNCLNDSDYDGVCDELEIPGCTDENACNFSNLATDGDGSCEYVTCAGCQYEFACNYDPSATITNNESCEYGTCPGCTDPTACNYNPTVSEDDGSCLMLDVCGVCGGSGVYEGTIFDVDFGDGVIIPDDPSQCFGSQLSVTGFNEETVISDANNDIVSLFMNLEHSYMGDLLITLICPNGQSLVVHEQGGGGTLLGVPNDNNWTQSNVPGIGWDYWWEPGATNGTWVDNSVSVGTLPSGSYESVQPFTNLNGCPLNGTWELAVCDIFASDNGFIFNWSLETSLSYDESCDCDGNVEDECGVCGGDGSSCIEECEGVLDECGICGGEGISEGDCDCTGHILDECGVCGGAGIAEGECDCEGNVLDECGVCGGAGIPTEDCDCEGNQLDVLGECGGDCANDFNGDGICDVDETLGCTYPDALNFNEEATADDGSCTYEEFDLEAVYDSGYSDGFGDGENSVICPETSSCPSDLDGNGDVGMSDLLIFLSSFGAVCEITAAPWMCGDLIEHEGYDYSTVIIGEQCWFAENCRYLPEVSPSSEGSETSLYYYVNDYQGTDVEEAKTNYNYETYGVLYNWPAVMTDEICPTSWHIPLDGEWSKLEIELGMNSNDSLTWGWRGDLIGSRMKASSASIPPWDGINTSGLTVFPGGYRTTNGTFSPNNIAYIWSSTNYNDGGIWRELATGVYSSARVANNYSHGHSARCIKD